MIKFDNVTKIYDKNIALDNVSFEIEAGEFITIIGGSGSGKTTILKMINRLIDPTTGSILFDGKCIQSEDPILLRRNIGYVVQEVGLFPHYTVEQNIEIVPNLLGWEKSRIHARTKELLSLISLPYDEFAQRLPHQLSGGQRQRVGVARALAGDPKIMLFDEPFGAIDAITRSELQNELIRIHKSLEKKTFIFITHDINEALFLGTRVMVVEQGRIIQLDTPERIINNPKNEYVSKLISTARDYGKFWINSND